MSAATGLVGFVTSPQWVAWRNEMRNGKITKVPYCSATRQAEADDASTWLPHDQAVLIADAIVNGSGGGIGIELGQCGEAWIAGVDFDSCCPTVAGIVEPWAATVIERLNSYTEVSPSQTGVKAFSSSTPPTWPSCGASWATNTAASSRAQRQRSSSKHRVIPQPPIFHGDLGWLCRCSSRSSRRPLRGSTLANRRGRPAFSGTNVSTTTPTATLEPKIPSLAD